MISPGAKLGRHKEENHVMAKAEIDLDWLHQHDAELATAKLKIGRALDYLHASQGAPKTIERGNRAKATTELREALAALIKATTPF